MEDLEINGKRACRKRFLPAGAEILEDRRVSDRALAARHGRTASLTALPNRGARFFIGIRNDRVTNARFSARNIARLFVAVHNAFSLVLRQVSLPNQLMHVCGVCLPGGTPSCL
jgi:hypothetical protein